MNNKPEPVQCPFSCFTAFKKKKKVININIKKYVWKAINMTWIYLKERNVLENVFV